MSKTKAIIDFNGYSGPDLCPAARAIHDGMEKNKTLFANPPVTMADLLLLIETAENALAAKSSRATVDTIAFNIARHALEEALADLGGYVNEIAKGDAMDVSKSGFPSYETGGVPDTAPPAAPENVVLRHGDLSGTINVRYRPIRQRSINEVQINDGDPNTESNWKHAGMYSGGKAVLGNLTPGTTIWVRVRSVGLKGVMGAWSDPAKIIVI
jgi:hypothetical protein